MPRPSLPARVVATLLWVVAAVLGSAVADAAERPPRAGFDWNG